MFKWFVSSFILLSILKNDVASAMPDKENRDQPEDLLVHGIRLLPQWYATNWSLWNHIFRESIHASGFDLGEIEESIDQVQKMLGAHENLFDYRE